MNEDQERAKNGQGGLTWALVKRMSVPGLVAVYLTCGLLAVAWLLLDISSGQMRFLGWLGIQVPANPEYRGLLKAVLYAAAGGAVGGISFGMMNLQKHAAAEGDHTANTVISDPGFKQVPIPILIIIKITADPHHDHLSDLRSQGQL